MMAKIGSQIVLTNTQAEETKADFTRFLR